MKVTIEFDNPEEAAPFLARMAAISPEPSRARYGRRPPTTKKENHMKTFDNGYKVVPCVVASEPDDNGVVTVFAAEDDGDDVKAFPAVPGEGGADFQRA